MPDPYRGPYRPRTAAPPRNSTRGGEDVLYVSFGKHRNMSAEALVLKEPAYILWMLRQPVPSGQLAAARARALRLIAVFDAKPLLAPCEGPGCSRPATRCTVYGRSIDPYHWCDDCDPYSLGASPGKIQVVRSYRGAAHHVEFFCGGSVECHRRLVRHLARARGLPDRVGEAQARAFFAV